MKDYNSQFYFTISVMLFITYKLNKPSSKLGLKIIKLESANYLLTAEEAKRFADNMLGEWSRRGLEQENANAEYRLKTKIQISDPYSF